MVYRGIKLKSVLSMSCVIVCIVALWPLTSTAENAKRAIRRPSPGNGPLPGEIQTIPPITLNKGFELVPQTGHTWGIEDLAVDRKGEYLASGSYDGTVKIWHVKTGALIRTIQTPYQVTAVSIGPSGKTLYAGNYSNSRIQCFDMATGVCLKTFTVPKGTVYTLKGDVSGSQLIVGTSVGLIVFLDMKTGHAVRTIDASTAYTRGVQFQIYAAAQHPSGTILATNGEEGDILVWDVATGRLINTFRAHRFSVFTAAFDPTGQHLITGGADCLVNIWDMPQGHLVRSLKGHVDGDYNSITRLILDKQGTAIISTDQKGQIRVWGMKTGRPLRSMDGHAAGIFGLVVNPSSGMVITGGKDRMIKMWDMNEGRLIRDFALPAPGINAVDVDPLETVIVSGGWDREIRVWDLSSGMLKHVLRGHDGAVTDLKISRDGTRILSASDDKTIRIWDLRKGRLTKTLKAGDSPVRVLAIHPGGKTFASGNDKGELTVWELASGKRIRSSIDSFGGISAMVFDPKGKILMAADQSGSILFQEYRTGKVLARTETGSHHGMDGTNGHSGRILSLACDPQGRYVMSSASDGRVIFWTTDTGKFIHAIRWNDIGLSIIPDATGERIISGSLDGSIKLWDIRYEDIVNALKPINKSVQVSSDMMTQFTYCNVKATGVNDIKLISGGRRIVAGDQKGTLIIWDLESNEHFRLLSRGDSWIMYTPDGYFDGSPDGGELMAVVKGMNVYGVDQFALRCNRPDLILDRMGLGNDRLIDHFRLQFLKRLRRMGITVSVLTGDSNPPEANILGSAQKGKTVRLDLLFRDKTFALKRYNIYINDVPLYGSGGKALSGNEARLTETVELTFGKNKIEAACLNANGVESFRDVVFKEFNQITFGDLYFIGLGVSTYKDPNLNLSYAHKDALDLARILPSMIDDFNEIRVAVLTNDQATSHAVAKVKSILKNARVDDTVILFIAGHGVHDTDEDATYYFLTHDTDLNHLPQTAARFEAIEEILQGIPPRKKLFLMDTCESGEQDGAEAPGIVASAGSRGIVPRTARAIAKRMKTTGKGLTINKDRYIYNDLIRRSGAVVLSSSKGNEFSYESADYENGLFTEALIDAFTSGKADTDRNYSVSTEELRRYVQKRVSAMSKGLQNPTVDRDNLYQPIPIPLVTEPIGRLR